MLNGIECNEAFFGFYDGRDFCNDRHRQYSIIAEAGKIVLMEGVAEERLRRVNLRSKWR